jgi:carboxymethylenebutenolidase
MCHSDASRPPGPPDPGGVAAHGRIELTAADGNRFSGYRADPAAPNGANLVLLPDVRALHPFYEDLAQRFAEAGFTTVAVDYFGRTAGTGPRDDSFPWQEHVSQIRPEQVRTDVAAAVELLRAGNPGPVFTVGFCFGGSHSWRLSAAGLGLAGAIGFYGKPSLVDDVLPELSAPLLLLVAGADRATPTDDFHGFAARLDQAGKVYEMHVYPGAPHSFFDRAFAEWREACADAWRRIIDFTARHR